MTKIDLITGFLGSGKTTFLKRYAGWLLDQGLKTGIIENDFGAVNVDMLLLQDLEEQGAATEMVAAADLDCYRRRFKTKLIALGMQGLDRVLVEPSGIYDPEEFFDVLYEDPLSRWYEIGSVIAIADAKLEDGLSRDADYLLEGRTVKGPGGITGTDREYHRAYQPRDGAVWMQQKIWGRYNREGLGRPDG